jgi:hypothetical protein
MGSWRRMQKTRRLRWVSLHFVAQYFVAQKPGAQKIGGTGASVTRNRAAETSAALRTVWSFVYSRFHGDSYRPVMLSAIDALNSHIDPG